MTQVWAFSQVSHDDDDDNVKALVYDSIKSGKSRFGWSCNDTHNLKLTDNWSDNHPGQLFLLSIKEKDWIVHINTPKWGKCIAGQVISEYDFDEGLQYSEGKDFRHNFSLDLETIIEFDRKDYNMSPRVNLCPRGRYHRVYKVDDFIQSIKRLKNKSASPSKDVNREEHYLKVQTESYLKKISADIHEMYRGKDLESFLARVMRKIPNVKVVENGSQWGTDHGADLIVTIHSDIGIDAVDFLEHKIIVQIKSFEGSHYDLTAGDQIKEGIKKYEGTAGMLITTGEITEKLAKKIEEVSAEIDLPIALLCGRDVARFVVQHAPDLLFNL